MYTANFYRRSMAGTEADAVSVMCNLSQGIVDDTEAKIIMNMYESKFSLEQISLATKKSIAEVERIIKENKPVLA